MPAAPAGPAGSDAPAPAPDILGDLDAFSRKVDEEQRALAAAAAWRRREAEEARRKAEAERTHQAEAKRQAESEKPKEGPRFEALEILRRQAATRPPVQDDSMRRAQAMPVIHRSLISSMHYLAQFAKEVNSVRPSTEGPYLFAYLQKGSPLVLSSAFADYRARKVEGEDVCDHVYLKYQARFEQPVSMSVTGSDVELCRRMLSLASVPFEFSASKKNDFGQALSGTFTISGPIPCEVTLRADYDGPAVLIEVLNVGRLGPGRCRLAPEAFSERMADEIAKYALAAGNEFAKLLDA